MPFKPKFRDYEEGDFTFGVAEGIASFQTFIGAKTGINFKASLSSAPTTVRQLSTSRSDVAKKFTGERAELNNAYLDALEHHPKYINAPDLDYANDTVRNNAVFRAKSKAGLHYCIVQGKYLHFILDKLGLHEVLAKDWKHPTKPMNPNNEFKSGPTDKVRTVTGAELRWIYRNSFRPETQELVQFWCNNAPCCPPWEAGFAAVDSGAPLPSAWKAYKDI